MAFMVIALHAGFLREFTLLGEYLSVNGFFRIAVPVFLIINGFYFYPVLTQKTHAYWLKRISILYIFWMVFYSYFWFSIPEFSFISFAKFLQNIFIGYYHLWYLSGVIGAAIILIILARLSSKVIVGFSLITFICGVIIQYLGNYHVFEGSIIDKLFNLHWFHRNMLFLAFPFFSIGYLINKHSLHSSISVKTSCTLCFLGVLALFGESYINYYQEERDGGFDNLLSLLFVCPFVLYYL